MKNLFPQQYRQEDIQDIISYLKQKNKLTIFYLNGVGKNPFFKRLGWRLNSYFKKDIVINIEPETITQLISALGSSLKITEPTKSKILDQIDSKLEDKSLILNLQFNYIEGSSASIKILGFVNTLRKHNSSQVLPVINLYWTHTLTKLIDTPSSLDLFNGIRIYHECFSKENFHEALYYFEKKNRILFDKEKEVFWKISGGLPRIYKQAYIFSKENKISLTSSNFLKSFLVSERFIRYSKQLVNDIGDINQNISTLRKFRFIAHDGKPIAKALVHTFNKSQSVHAIFTKFELNILKILEGKDVVSKKEIAQQLWGTVSLDKKNLSATIDKHISNIRKKLTKHSLGEIKAHKGRGVSCTSYGISSSK